MRSPCGRSPAARRSSTSTVHGAGAAALAEEAFTPAPAGRRRRPRTCATLIHETFEYDPAFTDVSTPLSVVLDGAARRVPGLRPPATGCLRSLGLAARYVSGYIETDPPPGRDRARRRRRVARVVLGVGARSRAGSTSTRRTTSFPTHRHVTVAWGRDYGDVAPVRGVVIGPAGEQTLDVAVDVAASHCDFRHREHVGTP